MQREPLSFKVLLRHFANGGRQHELNAIYGEEEVSTLVGICRDRGYVEAEESVTHDHPRPSYKFKFMTPLGAAKLKELEEE